MNIKINKIAISVLTVVVLSFIMGAHAYSKDNPKNDINNPVVTVNRGESAINTQDIITPVKAQKVMKTVLVKNIWNDMPSYDKYGNEITPRARFNMMQNSVADHKSNNSASSPEVIK